MTPPGNRRSARVPEWPTATAWADLSPLDRAAWYEANAPKTHVHYLVEDAALARHERRLAWANWALRLAGLVLGGAVVAGMILLSWHAIDSGEPQQVKWIVGTPTVALAGIFVTGKAINANLGRRAPAGVAAEPDPGDAAPVPRTGRAQA